MSKKIVFNNLGLGVVEVLSAWSVAEESLKTLKASYDAEKTPLEEKLAASKKSREEELEKGVLNRDEVFSLYPIDDVIIKLDGLANKYAKDCAPHKAAQRKARNLVPDCAFASYCLTFEKGVNAVGDVTIGKNKKARTVSVSTSYNDVCREFLENIGLANQNETALRKFAEGMAFRTAGGRKDNENYIGVNGENSYKDKFIRALLRLLVVEKGVLTKSEDGKLTRTIFAD